MFDRCGTWVGYGWALDGSSVGGKALKDLAALIEYVLRLPCIIAPFYYLYYKACSDYTPNNSAGPYFLTKTGSTRTNKNG